MGALPWKNCSVAAGMSFFAAACFGGADNLRLLTRFALGIATLCLLGGLAAAARQVDTDAAVPKASADPGPTNGAVHPKPDAKNGVKPQVGAYSLLLGPNYGLTRL